jgi:transposase
MGRTAILPAVDTAPEPGVRYFTARSCVICCEGLRQVFVGGSLIGTYGTDEPVKRDLLVASVCQDGSVRFNRVAEAFELGTETVRRIRRRFEEGGLEAIAHSHRRGRPRRCTAPMERRLFQLFDAGATVSEAHARVKGRLSRAAVGRVRKQWAADQSRAPAKQAEAETQQPLGTALPAERESESGEAGIEEQEPELVAASAEVDPEQVVVEGGRRVEHLGSWIMLGMLNALGLYALAERLRVQTQRQHSQRGQRFVGAAALRAALDAVVVALSIGQRCVEGVRRLGTSSSATLLRRSGAMSATWTRRVLGRFAEFAGLELHWRQALSLLETASESEERVVFYVDNHLRPYTGKHTIRKGWRMQDKRVRPGSSDYYVHDEQGRPLLRIDDAAHGSLGDWLGPVARLLREALGGETKVLTAFDRAGAFPEQMASLRDDALEFVTYERAPYQLLPEHAFDQELELGEERLRFTEAGRKNLGKGRGRVRRICVRTEQGAQLNVLAVSEAPAAQLVTVLLRRWSYQENQFKHEVERWGINQLDGRQVEPYPADEVIPNPARRRLDRELRIARATEGEALRRLAQLDEDDPRREAYQQDLARARRRQQQLEAQRPQIPTHAPVCDTELASKLMRHRGEYKLVIDTIRVALANVESDLAAWLGPELSRPAEAKKTLANLLAASGHLRLTKRTITVWLEPAGTASEQRAFESLLSRLNLLALRLPGDPSGRTLRFNLHRK